jgi:hypothetical protein
MKNLFCEWKTTLAAIVSAGSSFIVMFPDDFAGHMIVVHAAKFISVGGLVALGLVAKDAKVSASCDTPPSNLITLPGPKPPAAA